MANPEKLATKTGQIDYIAEESYGSLMHDTVEPYLASIRKVT